MKFFWGSLLFVCVVLSSPAQVFACASDSDCGGGVAICLAGRCTSSCKADADCPSGLKCKQGGCLSEDACAVDADCSGGKSCIPGPPPATHQKVCGTPPEPQKEPQVEPQKEPAASPDAGESVGESAGPKEPSTPAPDAGQGKDSTPDSGQATESKQPTSGCTQGGTQGADAFLLVLMLGMLGWWSRSKRSV